MTQVHRIDRSILGDINKPGGEDPFCSCNMHSNSDLYCNCGEEYDVHEWAWDEHVASPATLLSKQNREVRFHPGYSSGTAAVRGDSPFKQGNVYYWEIKMLTSLYGTDVMVGVGTKKVELDKSAYQFCSLLGSDKESWGFSYTGVAFRSLHSSVLFPMVCSTAAQSAMRVTFSVSHPVCLKLLSLQALKNNREAMKELMKVPGLRNYISDSWWLLYGSRNEDCEMNLDRGLRGRKRRGGVNSGGLLEDTCPHQQGPQDSNRRVRRLCMMCDIIL